MKNKKGFTLIELLAIIVILAIIAVITVPIILNIIENSKKGAAEDSAYGFKDAVQKAYVTKLSTDSDYVISDDTYTIDDLKLEIGLSLSGKEPSSNSWVTIEKNNVTEGCLQYDEFKVEFTDGKVSNTEKGECSGSSSVVDVAAIIASLNGVLKSDGATYISDDDGFEIYYNPESGLCNRESDSDKYVASNSNTGVTAGCMRWYIYSVKGDYANMMLDHNITVPAAEIGRWAYSDTYNDVSAATAGITYPEVGTIPVWGSSYNARGPVTSLNTLKSLTNDWDRTYTPKVPNSSSANEYIITKDKNDNKYQIDYTGYKARLITDEEAGYLGCTTSSNSCPEWMIKGTHGEDTTAYAGVYGYWTSSPNSEYSVFACRVSYNRDVDRYDATSTDYGVRPVITVKITDVLTEPLS